MRHHSSKSQRRRRGAIIVWVVLSLTAIVGVVALGMDGGRLMEERRHAQATADAAALAGAADLYANWWTNHGLDTSDTAKSAALALAAANGYYNDGTTSVVTVNIPPKSGSFAGQTNYVEVIVRYNMTRSFSAIFTGGDLPVQARAVAVGQPSPMGLIILNPTAAGALTSTGSAGLVLLNQRVYVNSSNPQAFIDKSTAVMLASSFRIVGGYVDSGGLILGPIQTGASPTADPLRNLASPNLASYPIQSAKTLKPALIAVLAPGRYQGGIQANGLGTVVTMLPGVYIMEGGGLQVTGGAALLAVGATIYNTSGASAAGPISVSGGGSATLVAPLSGTYQGISIFQDRAVNQPIALGGVGVMAVTGLIYAPSAPVTLSNSAAAGLSTMGGAYICDTLSLSGSVGVSINIGNNYPRVPEVNLVE